MAAITPWVAKLVEAELENLIAWKSVVKDEPDASDEDTPPRFSDDGSNLRSYVGASTLSPVSMIQLIQVSTIHTFLPHSLTLTTFQKPGLNARAKIPVSDGDVSVLVVLSDSAWEAYDNGIAEERGDEPRKGDLLICKRIVIVSTPWGPTEERVTIRIEELEYAGNIRITIGKPISLHQSASIVALRAKIEGLALKQHEMDEMDEMEEESNTDDDDEVMNDEQATAATTAAALPEHTNCGGSVDVEMETIVERAAHVLPDVVPTPSLDTQNAPEPEEEEAIATAPSPPPTNKSPIVSRSPAQFQIETQLEVEATQVQAPQPPARNPIRRNRGGYSMGREGFETTRGDNLTGPQAPTLHHRQGFPPAELSNVEPKKEKLLDLMSKMPGQQPRNRSPEPSAPVSAQQEVAAEEVVIETPAKRRPSPKTFVVEDATPAPAQKSSHAVLPSENKGKRRRPSPTSLESTSAPRRIYRIPKNQQALLDDRSSWLPPAPGHEFPHPNVPVRLLRLWNTKAELQTKSPLQPSPIALIEQSSGAKSVEELQPEPQADDSESDSDELMSEDEPIDWSQSQPRSQALPPDSSAAPPSSDHTPRLGSRDGATPTQELATAFTTDFSDTFNGRKDISKQSRSKDGTTPTREQATAYATDFSDTFHGRHEKFTQSGSQRESQAPATTAPNPVVLPTQPTKSEQAESLPKQKARAITEEDANRGQTTARNTVASQSESSSLQNANAPASSSRSQAPPARSQITKQQNSQQNYSLPPTSGANRARPVHPQDHWRTSQVASQLMLTGPRKSAPLADNHLGPVQASTQQTPHRPYRATEPKSGTSFTTPTGAPTGPRATTEHRYSVPTEPKRGGSNTTPAGAPTGPRATTGPRSSVPTPNSSNKNTPDPKALPFGGFYVPMPSQPSKESPPSQASRPDPAGTQTSEMETSVPRSMPPPPPHREQRRDYMRDAQRKHW